MKNLSLVFIIHRDENTSEYSVLMGRQAKGKKLAGFRNGYGGKCEEGETTLGCAKRELEEELKMIFPAESFKKCGDFKVADKNIDCFVVEVQEKFKEPEDNTEFENTKWIELKDISKYFFEMLEGDSKVMEAVAEYINTGKTFSFEKNENELLRKQTEGIFRK